MSAKKCCELVSAIQSNDLKKFKVLLKSRKISRLPNPTENYRLIKTAINQKRRAIVDELIKKRVEVKSYIQRPTSKLLHTTVRFGQLKLVKKLISRRTPLHIAAKYGNFKIMEVLLKNGANVRSVVLEKIEFGFTPLHFECRGKHMKCIKLLLKFSNNVGVVIPGTIEPIHIAVILLHSKMVSLLLNNGANVNARFRDEFYPMLGFNLNYRIEEENFTLLLCAISQRSIKISQLLLEHGADISKKSYLMSITPLIEAVETNDPKMIRFILDNGGISQVNEYSAKGSSPLHHVITNADTLASPYGDVQIHFVAEKLEIFDILVAAGADLNAKVKDCYDWTILELAIHFGFRQIVDYILYKTDFDSSHLDYSTVKIAQFHDFMLTEDITSLEYIDEWRHEFKVITYNLIFEILRREAISLFKNEETIKRLDQQPGHINVTEEEHQKIMKEMKNQIHQVVCEMKSEKIGDSKITF
ncbi:ankyrin-1-like [Cotesia glomerata]|uniref:ankyrin-1-like n=1 Tax=Cotesia glomerata TaxID=32391 RepID=UPI001D00F662|nr:ankyrin-1-like [Cotesia glomerata]